MKIGSQSKEVASENQMKGSQSKRIRSSESKRILDSQTKNS